MASIVLSFVFFKEKKKKKERLALLQPRMDLEEKQYHGSSVGANHTPD